MKLSNGGIARIEDREGARGQMYRDSAGLPTIGVGHLLTKDEVYSGKLHLPTGTVDWHVGLSDHEIRELLEMDAARAEATVSDAVAVPLTQSQFDALVSFVFNVGIHAFRDSTLLRMLNQGDYAAVPEQLRRWVHSAGQVDPILVKRREDEITQWEEVP